MLLSLGMVVGQLFPVLADDEMSPAEPFSDSGDVEAPRTSDTGFNEVDQDGILDEYPELPSEDGTPPEDPSTNFSPTDPPVTTSQPDNQQAIQQPNVTQPGVEQSGTEQPPEDLGNTEPKIQVRTGSTLDGKISVESTYMEGILPEEVFIQPSLVTQEQKKEILKGLKASKYSIDGILPIDISFLVNSEESGPQQIPFNEFVDLKLTVDKSLLESERSIDWKTLELVRVHKIEDSYTEEVLVDNENLKLIEVEKAAGDTNSDQSTEQLPPANPIEEMEDVSQPEAANQSNGSNKAEVNAAVDDLESSENASQSNQTSEVNPESSALKKTSVYEGSFKVNGSWQVALVWKTKASSLLDDIKDTIGTISGEIKDLFDKVGNENFELPSTFGESTEELESERPVEDDKPSITDLIDKLKKPETESKEEIPTTKDDSNLEDKDSKQENEIEYKKAGKESSTIKIDDKEIIVTASYEEQTIPKDTKFIVKTLESIKQAEAVDELNKAQIEYDGSVSMDISFVQQNDGKEVEPNGPVKIDFEFEKELISNRDSDQEVDESTLQLIHHEKQDNEIVPVVIATADIENLEAMEAEKIDIPEITTGNSVQVKEVMVNSFSTFTLIWQNQHEIGSYVSGRWGGYWNWSTETGNTKLYIHFVDKDNQIIHIEDKILQSLNSSLINSSGEIIIEDWIGEIADNLPGKYLKATTPIGQYPYTDDNFNTITTIKYQKYTINDSHTVGNNTYKNTSYYTVQLMNDKDEVRSLNGGDTNLNHRADINIVLNVSKDEVADLKNNINTIYAYAAVPGKESVRYGPDADQQLNDNWVGVGIGTATNIPSLDDAVESYNYLKNINPAEYTLNNDGVVQKGQNYKNFTDLNFDGKWYKYLSSDTPPDQMPKPNIMGNYEFAENGRNYEGYYQVNWESLHKSAGRNVNESTAYEEPAKDGYGNPIKHAYFNDENGVVSNSEGFTYHLDGSIMLISGSRLTVQWFVKEPDEPEFSQWDSCLLTSEEWNSKKFNSEFKTHDIQDTKLKELDKNTTSHYSIGWYLDEACTIKINQETVYELAQEQAKTTKQPYILNVYAKFEKNIPVPTGLTEGNNTLFTVLVGIGILMLLIAILSKVYWRMNRGT